MGLREVGRNCVKFLKRGWNRTEGMGHKDFSKGGELGQGIDVSKRGRGGTGTPLQTMYHTMEHLSNDHEDCANQHQNNLKLMQ